MRCILKQVYTKRGMALPSVIIVSTLLLMMMVPLLNLSLQQFKISKSQSVVGSSYLASGSSTEFAIEAIKDYVKKKSYLSSYSPVVSNYLAGVRDDIFDLVKNQIASSIGVDPTKTAKSILKDVYIVGYEVNGNKILVTLGLVISSTYKNGINASTNSDVFSQVVIEIENNKKFFRPAAINTIGDIYVKDSSPIINGDVKVVGTAPEKTSQFEQYTYGGIYGVGNGKLTINGSAFVRSFIRCGNPSNSVADNFTIDIKDNAVAQCIQVFGNKDYILVRKDGYTFDDLEMNGLDSVIAINRNYYGLTNIAAMSGVNEYHDASSAIVNSAVIHHPDEVSLVDAMKSKIVINGNVMINGGTFWIDPVTGNFVSVDATQIENASCAWNDTDEIASYKNFEPDSTPGVKTFHNPLGTNKSSWISGEYYGGRANGYSNLFQAFQIQTDAQIDGGWFNSLKSLGFGVNPPGFINRSTIKGFCHYEMSANGKMYFMDTVTDPNSGSNSDIKLAEKTWSDRSKVDFENSLNYLSIVDRQDYITGSKRWDNLWNFDGTFFEYFESVKDGLSILKEPLIKITEDFVKRQYDFDAKKINNTMELENSTNQIFFNYIGTKMQAFDSSNDARVITDSEIVPVGGNYELPTPLDSSMYYIIVINDPDKTLVLKNTLNAIVYTRGKVIMAPGSILNGFIIAAGKGYTRAGGLGGSAADNMPFTYYDSDTVNNLNYLDDGDFAAVSFDPGGTATVNFDFVKNADGTINYDGTIDYVLDQFSSETFYLTLKELFKS